MQTQKQELHISVIWYLVFSHALNILNMLSYYSSKSNLNVKKSMSVVSPECATWEIVSYMKYNNIHIYISKKRNMCYGFPVITMYTEAGWDRRFSCYKQRSESF